MGRATDIVLGAICGGATTLALLYVGRRRMVKPKGGSYHAGMIKAKPEMIEQYMQLHDATWTEVMERMYECNMRDFVVWLHKETNTMFHQFVYVGSDFDADMAKVGADPIVRFWWTYCEPCQAPLHWKGPPPCADGLEPSTSRSSKLLPTPSLKAQIPGWIGRPAASRRVVGADGAGQPLRCLGGHVGKHSRAKPGICPAAPRGADVDQGHPTVRAQPHRRGKWLDELAPAALCAQVVVARTGVAQGTVVRLSAMSSIERNPAQPYAFRSSPRCTEAEGI